MGLVYREPGVGLAYEFMEGAGPVVVFCSGYGSDMGGTKAMRLWEFCRARGQAMLRFDYAGHGASGGRFEDGCIGDWLRDAAFIIGAVASAREVLLVGSSMGGWIALLLAIGLKALVKGMVLIAPAPDFTEDILRRRLSKAQLKVLRRDGVIYPPSEYGAPLPLTLKLLEDGKKYLLLGGKIGIHCPVRVLHGMEDPDVEWDQSLTLANCLETGDVRLIFIKDGDHRLSREQDLLLLEGVVEELIAGPAPAM